MLDKGSLVKVKINHFQEQMGDEELKGFVTALELRENRSDEGGGFSLWAEMHLYPDTYEKYSSGLFPEFSIYPRKRSVDRAGNEYPNVLEHVALCGASRGALPELNTSMLSKMFSAFSSLVDKMTSILPKNKGARNRCSC